MHRNKLYRDRSSDHESAIVSKKKTHKPTPGIKSSSVCSMLIASVCSMLIVDWSDENNNLKCQMRGISNLLPPEVAT